MGLFSRMGGCRNSNHVSGEMLWFIILFLLLFSCDSCANGGNECGNDGCESCC